MRPSKSRGDSFAGKLTHPYPRAGSAAKPTFPESVTRQPRACAKIVHNPAQRKSPKPRAFLATPTNRNRLSKIGFDPQKTLQPTPPSNASSPIFQPAVDRRIPIHVRTNNLCISQSTTYRQMPASPNTLPFILEIEGGCLHFGFASKNSTHRREEKRRKSEIRHRGRPSYSAIRHESRPSDDTRRGSSAFLRARIGFDPQNHRSPAGPRK
jgi:hypothetical protein